ncbi:ATP nucleotide 3'-pyrophosphokinase [Streptomyces marinisediminis]|uniref:ATP nucleotide 3'-pyrophosphokinase n=1 Tax=Streptomyces marinisediminis TaxID=2984864 RepID=UPI0022494ADA|nr:ATP nucleotide 3'-pyrophosphokinase [Streptomyces sp. JHD 1]MCX2967902.1 ATP nucleotide 3'-pyrophosphokinase [Streptomyces sp. JHD 1]
MALAAALGLTAAPSATAAAPDRAPLAAGAVLGKGITKPLPVGPPTGHISVQAEREAAADPGRAQPLPAEDAGWAHGDLRLDASDNAAVNAFMDQARKAERTISPQIRTVASWTGAEVVGFDQRMKSEDSLKRKIATWLTEDPDQTVHEALADLNDSVRYTLQWDDAEYTEGVEAAASMLAAWDHENVRWANTWKNHTGYKAINTAWRDPMYAHAYEIQFHTPASREAALATHPLYEEQRLPSTSPERKAELAEQQGRIFAAVPVPAGARELTAPVPTRPARVPLAAQR